MGVNDPGGGISLSNYYSGLGVDFQIGSAEEPRRKIKKGTQLRKISEVHESEKRFLVIEAEKQDKDLSRANPFLVKKTIDVIVGENNANITRIRGGKLLALRR